MLHSILQIQLWQGITLVALAICVLLLTGTVHLLRRAINSLNRAHAAHIEWHNQWRHH